MLGIRRRDGNRDRFGFRFRGLQVTRLESFSDGVFAFGLTLLVVSLQVPRSFTELMQDVKGFPAFALSSVFLLLVWNNHCIFFKRYGLEDGLTRMINGLLLLTVVGFIYPLKFLFTQMFDQFFGSGIPDRVLTDAQVPTLFLIYGLAFTGVETMFAVFYLHAYRKRSDLELDDLEVYVTRSEISRYLLSGSVGVLSASIAQVHGLAAYAGMSYFLIPLVIAIHGTVRGYQMRRLGFDRLASNQAFDGEVGEIS